MYSVYVYMFVKEPQPIQLFNGLHEP